MDSNEVDGKVQSNDWVWWVVLGCTVLAFVLAFILPRVEDPKLPTVNTIDGPVLNEVNQADVWCETHECKG